MADMTLALEEKPLPRLDDKKTRMGLREGSVADRVNIVCAIGNRGSQAARFAPDLIALLEDSSLRWEVAAALGRIGPKARVAVPSLLTRLKDPESPDREILALALAKIDPSSGSTTKALSDALGSKNDRVSAGAAVALGDTGLSAAPALSGLVAALDRKLPVSYFAVRALGRLGSAAAPALPALRKIVASKRNPKSFPIGDAAESAIKAIGRPQ